MWDRFIGTIANNLFFLFILGQIRISWSTVRVYLKSRNVTVLVWKLQEVWSHGWVFYISHLFHYIVIGWMIIIITEYQINDITPRQNAMLKSTIHHCNFECEMRQCDLISIFQMIKDINSTVKMYHTTYIYNFDMISQNHLCKAMVFQTAKYYN